MQAQFIQAVPTYGYTGRISLKGMSDRIQNRIREYREQRGMTLESLAELLECSVPQLQKLESGERRLNEKWISRLCQIFHIQPGELFHSSGDKPMLYTADIELMQQARHAIEASARSTQTRLTSSQLVEFTVELYNHAMEYRMRGKQADPSEPMAALILRRHIN